MHKFTHFMHFFNAFQSPAENVRHYWKKLIQIEKVAQNEKGERIKLSKYIITLTAVFIECFFALFSDKNLPSSN